MTLKQLASYDLRHGGPIGFGGTDVVRLTASKAPSIIPAGYRVQPKGSSFNPRDYRVLDSWKGQLCGHAFLLDVYRARSSNEVVVAVSYARRVVFARVLTTGRYVLREFTGAYVLFGIPGINGPFEAVNLRSGAWVGVLKDQHQLEQVAGCYPGCMAAGGPNWIIGLAKKYGFQPKK